ncbi:MAG: hypothetical protein OXG85_03005 [Chloroflexi bacterium]|nr:hypothetical protein [Chloroflexota bacterium]
MIAVRRFCSALAVSLSALHALVACAPVVPARVPPYVHNTPGAFVVVTDTEFDAGSFRLRFPRSWRVVILSPADAEKIHVAFVAPDGSMVALQQVDAEGPPVETYITLPDGQIVRIFIEPAAEPSPSFLAQARQLVASVRN